MQLEIDNNYRQIKQDIKELVEREMERIKKDPLLQHLVRNE